MYKIYIKLELADWMDLCAIIFYLQNTFKIWNTNSLSERKSVVLANEYNNDYFHEEMYRIKLSYKFYILYYKVLNKA